MKKFEFNFAHIDSSKPLTNEQLRCFQMAYQYMQSGIFIDSHKLSQLKTTPKLSKLRRRIG